MESPCRGTALETSDKVLQQLFVTAALTECYGLAHTLAIAEDNFSRYEEKHRGKKARRKPSSFTHEQMAELADSIGTSYENVEAAMTTEYSNWWQVSQMYVDRVEAERSTILDCLHIRSLYRDHMEVAWITGTPSHGESSGPDCHSEYDRELVERCVRAFIGYFHLIIDQANAGTLFTPARTLIEKQ